MIDENIFPFIIETDLDHPEKIFLELLSPEQKKSLLIDLQMRQNPSLPTENTWTPEHASLMAKLQEQLNPEKPGEYIPRYQKDRLR